MKLTDVKTWVVGNPPPSLGGRYFIFVKLTTDGGVHGYGEAYCATFDPHLTAKLIEDVAGRYFLGKDPHKIEEFFRLCYSSGFSQTTGRDDDGLLFSTGNGLLGHYRQGSQPAGLQSPGRAGA